MNPLIYDRRRDRVIKKRGPKKRKKEDSNESKGQKAIMDYA